MTRPTIGITTQTLEAVPGQLPRCWVMSQRYVNVLASVGAAPWVVPLLDDEDALRAIYERLDGVFLPGGVDIDPVSYRETRRDACGPTDPARDRTEIALVRWAVADRKPVLAVCRGVQLLNVAFGGTLYQDLAGEHAGAIKHDFFPSGGYARDHLSHEVRVVEGTQLAHILGASRAVVNSMHHQGISMLAPGLVASAHAEDGLIEGVEGTGDDYLVGVQWHPEELVERDAGMRRLFTSFIDAAREVEGSQALR